jgi:hypothetical protein
MRSAISFATIDLYLKLLIREHKANEAWKQNNEHGNLVQSTPFSAPFQSFSLCSYGTKPRYTVKPLLSDARSSDSRINRPNFNQVDCDRFLPARVG